MDDRLSNLLSNLPDDILTHILSFLPSEESVRTTVLSTRWDKLFTRVPVLHFSYYEDLDDHSDISTFIVFVNFVFIFYRLAYIQKFYFYFMSQYEYDSDDDDVIAIPIVCWISAAIHKDVEQIDVTFTSGRSLKYMLPRSLFQCKTLTHLKLTGYFQFVAHHNSKVWLPCLRTCFLCFVTFDDQSAQRLFKSCPMLEDLHIRYWEMGESVEVLDISGFNLKRLVIAGAPSCKVALDVPSLLFLQYYGHVKEFLGMETLKSVVDASIGNSNNKRDGDNVVVKLVCSIHHVQQLYLDDNVIKAFSRSGHSLPTFNDLTRLTFSFFLTLPVFCMRLLDIAPRLEFLVLYKGEKKQADETNYSLPERVPECVSLHLKEVAFKYWGEGESKCKLVEYIRKHGKNLKKITWNK